MLNDLWVALNDGYLSIIYRIFVPYTELGIKSRYLPRCLCKHIGLQSIWLGLLLLTSDLYHKVTDAETTEFGTLWLEQELLSQNMTYNPKLKCLHCFPIQQRTCFIFWCTVYKTLNHCKPLYLKFSPHSKDLSLFKQFIWLSFSCHEQKTRIVLGEQDFCWT